MSQIFNKVLQPIRNTVCVTQKRFKSNINIQKPKPFHFERQKVMRFLQPIISNPDTNVEWKLRCTNINKVKEEKPIHPYSVILGRELLNWFQSSKMVGIFHKNAMKQYDLFELAVPLKRANMYVKAYQPSIIKSGLTNTIYEPIMKLLQVQHDSHILVFSPEIKVKELMKITRKAPQVIFMAGIIENKLLSKNEFLKFRDLDLKTAQAGLVQVLRNAAGGNLNQQLTHHQSTLVTRLKQIGTKENESCDVNE